MFLKFLTLKFLYILLQITAPDDLTVLMSAIRQGEPERTGLAGKKVHRFYQKIPIQSYLIAIAAGNIESRKIGPRSHVWSEKQYGKITH